MKPARAVGGESLFFLCLKDRGGAEISMIKIAEGLRRRGRKVTLAVYGGMPELAREFGFSGDVIELPARRSAAAIMQLRALLRGGRYRNLVAALTHTNIVAVMAACLAGKAARVFATEHGDDGIAACKRSWWFAFLTRRAYGAAASVMCVSRGLADAWREIVPGAKFGVIHNPVIPDIMPPAPPPAHPWLSDKTTPVIMGIGRLKAEKNFVLLLRAFAALAEKKPARLIILGEGPQRPMLGNLAGALGIADKLLMPGFAADPAAWLAHADLFVSPSKREGFGNVIVEALSWGMPVVATDCPYGPAEILDNGRYGRLVPAEDVEAMAAAMRQGLENTHDRQALRLRAADYSVAHCIDLYESLLDNPALP